MIGALFVYLTVALVPCDEVRVTRTQLPKEHPVLDEMAKSAGCSRIDRRDWRCSKRHAQNCRRLSESWLPFITHWPALVMDCEITPPSIGVDATVGGVTKRIVFSRRGVRVISFAFEELRDAVVASAGSVKNEPQALSLAVTFSGDVAAEEPPRWDKSFKCSAVDDEVQGTVITRAKDSNSFEVTLFTRPFEDDNGAPSPLDRVMERRYRIDHAGNVSKVGERPIFLRK